MILCYMNDDERVRHVARIMLAHYNDDNDDGDECVVYGDVRASVCARARRRCLQNGQHNGPNRTYTLND